VKKETGGRLRQPTAHPAARLHGNRGIWKACAVALASAMLLAACTANDPLAEQAAAGDNKNYIAGDGSVSEFPPAARPPVTEFAGTLENGKKITAPDLRGEVTVLNFWYAACAPCRAEAPDLEALHQEFRGKDVRFLGINIRDQQATASAFERNFGVSYPSVLDTDGSILLGLSEFVPPQAVPTTLVLDKQGRITARILGITEKSTLRALIKTALETSTEAAPGA
jgi:thiol-disulfide isomerase/thioredoxin